MPPSEGFGAMPQPAAPQAPAPPPTAPAPAGAADGAVLRAICEGAGIRPEALQGVDPTTAGYEIGQALRIVAAELASLLRVRSEGKQRYEKSSRTMIGREANNPLKFIPTPNEALEVMFGPPRQGYLRGPQTMQSSFDDIKRHQYAIQAALQPALARLLEDLSPEAIEDKVGSARFGSKSAKAWDLFVERWDAKTHPYENGMLDVFQAYFSDAYHDASKGR
jgi:type VI secretion system FHA domain protein